MDPAADAEPSVLRHRLVRWTVAIAASGLLFAGGAALWAWRAATAGACTAAPADLTFDEVIAVKRRYESYIGDPTQPLVLDAREFSFVLDFRFGVPADVAVTGDAIAVKLSLDGGGRCWAVDYAGKVVVADGHAWLQPTRWRIGELEISPGLLPAELQVQPWMLDEKMGTAIAEVRRMAVADGRIELQLVHPRPLW